MATTITIGTWHEAAERITAHRTYYAADYEILDTKAGDYPVRLTFEGGYLVPMPYWLLVGVEADRVEGRTFNGFGGVNYGSNSLPVEPTTYTRQMYAYNLAQHVASGRVTLLPGFEWLIEVDGVPCWKHPKAPKTWDDVAAIVAQQTPADYYLVETVGPDHSCPFRVDDFDQMVMIVRNWTARREFFAVRVYAMTNGTPSGTQINVNGLVK